MSRCLVALNSQISVATNSVTPPLKSAQVKKIFSVTRRPLVTLAYDEAGPNIVDGLGRREAAGLGHWLKKNPKQSDHAWGS